MSKRRAVYTALTGGYETLSDNPMTGTGVDLVCFTDDPTLTSDSWEVVHVPRAFPSDPMRSQRLLKVLGHPALSEYEETLYIDNSVDLLVGPDLILDDWLSSNDIALMAHSFRSTVREEFDAVRDAEFDTSERLDEQLEHYTRDRPDVLTQRPYWGGMIARRQNSESVRSAMETWMRHILRYSRRDQLSINYALTTSGVAAERVELDNQQSPLHRWPSPTRISGRRPTVEFGWQYRDEVRSLAAALEERESLQRRLDDVLSSSSWRVTVPFRAVGDWIRRRRD